MPQQRDSESSRPQKAVSARHENLRKITSAPLSQRRTRTQHQLFVAGREIIAERGIGSTSVADICDRAGFTRGAFYSNFTNMSEFIEKIAAAQWSSITEVVDHALAQCAEIPAEEYPELTPNKMGPLTNLLVSSILLSREFYLLGIELSSYIIRSGGEDTKLRQDYFAFKNYLTQSMVTGLELIGRKCLLSAKDTMEIILACSERSMTIALVEGADNLTAYIERILPPTMYQITVPISEG